MRVEPGMTTALGTGAAGTTVLPGATLDVRGTKLGTEVVTIAGSGAGGELGALVDAGDTGTAAANRAGLGGSILARGGNAARNPRAISGFPSRPRPALD